MRLVKLFIELAFMVIVSLVSISIALLVTLTLWLSNVSKELHIKSNDAWNNRSFKLFKEAK